MAAAGAGEAARAAAAARPPLTRRAALSALGVIVLAALAVRGYHLGQRSIWFDEAFSWRLIEFPFPEMLRRVTQDNHVPLYFLLLKGWAALFGTSLVALRGLSVLLGGATVVGAYLFTAEALGAPGASAGRRARAREVALFVAALVALNVFQVRWAREVRMYSLGTALAAFSGWALFRALRAPPGSYRPWVLLGLLDLLFAYTHYYAFFTLAAQALFFLGLLLIEARGRPWAVWRDHRLRPALVTAGAVALAWLPWLRFFLGQEEQVRASFWTSPPTGWKFMEAYCRMFLVPENVDFTTAQAVAVVAGCGAVLLVLLWRARAAAWFVFLAATVPPALSVLLSVWITPIFVSRYLIFAQVFLLAALGLALGRLPWLRLRLVLYAAVLLASLGGDLLAWQALDLEDRPGSRGTAAFIDARRRPGEPVVVCSPLLFLSVLYHSADRADWYVYSPGPEVPHYEGAAVLTPADQIEAAQLRDLAVRRVWVVNIEGGSWGPRTVPVPDRWTPRGRHAFPEPYDFQGNTVVELYEVPESRPDGAAGAFRPSLSYGKKP
jgi:uncharacterized membrane protein